MNLVAYTLSGALISIFIFVFRRSFYSLAINSIALLDNMLSDVDEDEKMALIERSLGATVSSLFKFVLALVATTAIGLSPLFLEAYISTTTIAIPEADWLSILLMAVGSIVPWFFIKTDKNSDYSEISKLLHQIVLDNYQLGKKLFNIQVKNVEQTNDKFVIVSGLARAGTTALCMSLADRGPYHSLDYSNMPFLLSPRLWAYVYKPNNDTLKERKHADSVKIGLASVEALEEYFFKVFLNDSYIGENSLEKHTIDEELYKSYLKYQSSLVGDKIYLAKNNNLILRLDSLRKYNSKFTAIILFRDPVSHARSLLQQDRKFLQFQSEDEFILKYMNWLGHHEFGKGHKPFEFGNGLVEGDVDTMDYWLKVWINYYQYLLTIPEEYYLMDYEDFLTKPEQFLRTVASLTGDTIDTSNVTPFVKELDRTCDECDKTILDEAMAIYAQLLEKKVKL